jgi:hypothetical protein
VILILQLNLPYLTKSEIINGNYYDSISMNSPMICDE